MPHLQQPLSPLTLQNCFFYSMVFFASAEPHVLVQLGRKIEMEVLEVLLGSKIEIEVQEVSLGSKMPLH
jgi:hypothetical protein